MDIKKHHQQFKSLKKDFEYLGGGIGDVLSGAQTCIDGAQPSG